MSFRLVPKSHTRCSLHGGGASCF